jgi:SAM-dependent MidA family methyltransferase
LIKERLGEGPLPAAEFMGLALYHPVHGYYRKAAGPWGFAGKDYYTALDVGPLLGQCLCLRLEEAWRDLDRPAVFTVLEPGAGRGWLGRDLLEAARGDFAEALRYLHQDDNPAARSAAEEALAGPLQSGRARFIPEAEPLVPAVGAIISNELFDALPAQPWRWDGDTWRREVLAAAGPEWEAAAPGEAGAWFEANARGDRPAVPFASVVAAGVPSPAGPPRLSTSTPAPPP